MGGGSPPAAVSATAKDGDAVALDIVVVLQALGEWETGIMVGVSQVGTSTSSGCNSLLSNRKLGIVPSPSANSNSWSPKLSYHKKTAT